MYDNNFQDKVLYNIFICQVNDFKSTKRHRDRDRIVVGFTTTCAISAYHH